MKLEEIKTACLAGKTVNWKSRIYIVTFDSIGQWFIKCLLNGHLIGLTWRDGVTMNGEESDFYIA